MNYDDIDEDDIDEAELDREIEWLREKLMVDSHVGAAELERYQMAALAALSEDRLATSPVALAVATAAASVAVGALYAPVLTLASGVAITLIIGAYVASTELIYRHGS